MYDFDSVVNRNVPGDIKYEKIEGIDDLIPMWVADMDFHCMPEVSDALVKVAEEGLFGYYDADEEYYKAVTGWFQRRYDWEVDAAEIIPIPGVIVGIVHALNVLTKPEDHVLIFQPVYGQFERCVKWNGRIPTICDLKIVNGRYEIDLEEMEQKIREEQVKVLLWCSPHNPGGRVWTMEELKAITDLCLKYDVKIISDEIHADLTLGGRRHIPIAKVSKEVAQNSVILSSPTKSFNLAGIQAANIVVPDPELRKQINRRAFASGLFEISKMGIAATKAAYNYGETWLTELLAYVEENVALVIKELEDTKLAVMRPEGTYLVWIDNSACKEDGNFAKVLLEKAHVRVSEGIFFGKSGENFIRLNVACPRSILKEALGRIKKAVTELDKK